jgi:hypothetical protein
VENFYIEATECTPEIFFDREHHRLEIRGSSYPENARAFYAPVFFWLEEYFSQLINAGGERVTVNIEIEYFNSNSWKVLVGFFDLLDKAALKGIQVTINWIYEEDDEDILEYGEEFQEDHPDMVFCFVQKEV